LTTHFLCVCNHSDYYWWFHENRNYKIAWIWNFSA
jgi:hypothetical protein